jgi:hypothetical protein
MTRAVTRRGAILGTAALGIATSRATADGNAVDLQLVLAVDTSGSVTRERFILQRDGYVAAFRSREVQAAIAGTKVAAIAIVVTQWTGPYLQRVAVDWTRVRDAASCNAFADKIADAPRLLFSGGTSISGAIDHARELFAACPFQGPRGVPPRKVVDVSGDGQNNRGRAPELARDAAVANDITINGLPILMIEPGLDVHYRDHVIGGAGAFMIPAESYETFADAVRRKLVQEIA